MNKICQTFGVPGLREIDDQHLAGCLFVLCAVYAPGLTRGRACIPHRTNTDAIKAHIGGLSAAIGRADVFGVVVPATAANDFGISILRAGGVRCCAGIIFTIPIPHPFGGVAVHIVQAIGVGGVLLHGYGPSQIAVRTVHPISAGIVVIAVGIVAVGIAVMHIVAEAERRDGIGAGGILPLGLGRKAVAVGTLVPGDSCAGNGVAGRQSIGFTELVAIFNGIIPSDVGHR